MQPLRYTQIFLRHTHLLMIRYTHLLPPQLHPPPTSSATLTSYLLTDTPTFYLPRCIHLLRYTHLLPPRIHPPPQIHPPSTSENTPIPSAMPTSCLLRYIHLLTESSATSTSYLLRYTHLLTEFSATPTSYIPPKIHPSPH